MNAPDLYLAVHWTARLSALLFSTALIAPVLLGARQRARLAEWPFIAFVVAHTIHFGFVLALLSATGGKGMFPGGRDVADAGGLPAVLAISAFFYLVAGLALAGRRAGPNASAWIRWAGRGATVMLGYMFVSTYLPLLEESGWYLLPAALVTMAVGLDLFAQKFRELSCVHPVPPDDG